MAAPAQFNLSQFPTGYFMSWVVTTQAAFAVTVSLTDSSGTYFSASKQSTDINPPLASGSSTINGTGLTLTVSIPQSPGIQSSINAYSITRNDGAVVGYGYNISIEDGTDNDYNDVNISLVCWRSRG